jgi:bleomycin hydrolase
MNWQNDKLLIMNLKIYFLSVLMFPVSLILVAQEKEQKTDSGYVFTIVKKIPVTPVKNQARSGTCWSFAGISFLESELLRIKKDTFDLSEMFCIRNIYDEKATMYVRFHGKHNFGSGGLFHDVTHVLGKYGMVPDAVYNGMVIGEDIHMHAEMDAVLSKDLEAVIENDNKRLTPVWHNGFDGLLDTYLGKVPETFTWKGKEYTAVSYAQMLGLEPEDYIEITSFTHHPFYSRFIVEVPDNWAMGEAYNVPLEEMLQIIEYAIDNGFTVAWGGDTSEKGFSWKNGVAVVPDKSAPEIPGVKSEKWARLTDSEKDKLLYKFDKPMPEKKITQDLRQKEFDNYSTTDDHAMQISGIAHDQNGTKYYFVKNSWGLEGTPYKGYFYASESYVALKTTLLMIHKDALPKEIRKKLGL